LNLHLLRLFTTVAGQKSFSTAARLLHISQPAVSKSIQEFETQLGTILIDRSRRNVTLTDAGTLLFEHAQQLFAIERLAEKNLEELQSLERGHLILGASHTVGTYLLPPLLRTFHERYPAIKLSLEIKNTRDIIAGLQAVPFDMAFVEGLPERSDLIAVPWKKDRLVIVVSPHHPFASLSNVSIDQLTHFPFVRRESGSATREIIEGFFHDLELELNVAIELGSNQAVKQAVIAGLGFAIVSEATIELEQKAGALIAIECVDFHLYRTLSYITVRDRPQSRALMAFQELILEPLTP
jgi:DNA-binding transcriptional LysR family regulator